MAVYQKPQSINFLQCSFPIQLMFFGFNIRFIQDHLQHLLFKSNYYLGLLYLFHLKVKCTSFHILSILLSLCSHFIIHSLFQIYALLLLIGFFPEAFLYPIFYFFQHFYHSNPLIFIFMILQLNFHYSSNFENLAQVTPSVFIFPYFSFPTFLLSNLLLIP